MKLGNHAFRSVTWRRSAWNRAQRSTTRSLDVPWQPAYFRPAVYAVQRGNDPKNPRWGTWGGA
jgi:hypothetical protein